MLPKVPFIVLDQNAFRPHRGLLQPAIDRARRTGQKLLVSDVALVEMMKNEHWEPIARRSLAGLAGCPELVALGNGVPDLMRLEFALGEPGYLRLEDEERTPSLQLLLRELPTGQGPMLEHLRAAIVPAQQTISQPQYFDHQRNKATLLRLRNAWAKIVSKGDYSRIAASREEQASLLAIPSWGRVILKELLAAGLAMEPARRLAFGRSVTAHVLLTRSALALRWLVHHGLDGAAPEKVTNDVLDAEYVVLGSFCSELVTEERKVLDLLGVVEEAAELREAAPVDDWMPSRPGET